MFLGAENGFPLDWRQIFLVRLINLCCLRFPQHLTADCSHLNPDVAAPILNFKSVWNAYVVCHPPVELYWEKCQAAEK